MLLKRDLEMKAARAYASKDYARTVKLLTELLREVGENPHTLHMLARCSDHLGDIDHAIAYAERSLAVNPAHFGSLQIMTQAYYKRGDQPAAKRFARRALAHVPRRPALPLSPRWLAEKLTGKHSDADPEERRWVEWAREHVLEVDGVRRR